MRIKLQLSIVLVLLVSIVGQAQTSDTTKVEQVQDVVGALIGHSDKADVLLNDLAEISGYVTRLDADSFELKMNRKKRGGMKVRYTDVLAISSKRGSVSFVPDPRSAPYGDWSDLHKIPTNSLIEIINKNGESTHGRYRSSAQDHLLLAHPEKNEEWKFLRSEVAFVHRVRLGWHNTAGGALGGAQTGEKIGKGVGQVLGGMRGPISGASVGNGSGGLGRLIGAGIGAAAGGARGGGDKTDSLKILVYSR